MKPIVRTFQLLVLLPLITVALPGCEDEEEEEATTSTVSCSYQVSKTKCNGSTYSAYAPKCSTFSGVSLGGESPTSYCQGIYPATDTECVSSCCVKFKFKNVSGASGGCSGGSLLSAIGGNSTLILEASWSEGDVDLEMLTPMRKLVSSQNPQNDGCSFSGDDRYVMNGPVESVECQGVYLNGNYELILSNYSPDSVTVHVTATMNGEIIQKQTISVSPGEPETHSVSVQ